MHGESCDGTFGSNPGVNARQRAYMARCVFQMMREHYEESKQLNVYRRYCAMKQIIHVATSDTIIHALDRREQELQVDVLGNTQNATHEQMLSLVASQELVELTSSETRGEKGEACVATHYTPGGTHCKSGTTHFTATNARKATRRKITWVCKFGLLGKYDFSRTRIDYLG